MNRKQLFALNAALSAMQVAINSLAAAVYPNDIPAHIHTAQRLLGQWEDISKTIKRPQRKKKK